MKNMKNKNKVVSDSRLNGAGCQGMNCGDDIAGIHAFLRNWTI